MRIKLLGRSGLRVSELCLGAMTFGEDWGWGASKETCAAILDRYASAGGNFLDTAINYQNGSSEKIVGELIAGDRDHWVVATKYGISSRPDDPNFSGNHRKNMVQSVETSLERLRTDHIDLYWLHAWDFVTGIDEVMRGLDDLVRAGKIVYAGVSDTPAWIVSAANTMADLRGWSPFVGLQIEYSLVERTPERDLLPMARQFDLGVLAWAPLAAGLLTGKYRSVDDGGTGIGRLSEGSPRLTERNLAIARTVTEVAGALGVSPARVAIAWLRTRPGVVIPMLGARTVEQIDDDLASLDITLEEGHLAKLDAASAIGPSFPMNFLSQEAVLDHVYGTERGRFDFHRGRP